MSKAQDIDHALNVSTTLPSDPSAVPFGSDEAFCALFSNKALKSVQNSWSDAENKLHSIGIPYLNKISHEGYWLHRILFRSIRVKKYGCTVCHAFQIVFIKKMKPHILFLQPPVSCWYIYKISKHYNTVFLTWQMWQKKLGDTNRLARYFIF